MIQTSPLTRHEAPRTKNEERANFGHHFDISRSTDKPLAKGK